MQIYRAQDNSEYRQVKNEKKKRNQHPAHPRLHSRRRVPGKESRNSKTNRKNDCECLLRCE